MRNTDGLVICAVLTPNGADINTPKSIGSEIPNDM